MQVKPHSVYPKDCTNPHCAFLSFNDTPHIHLTCRVVAMLTKIGDKEQYNHFVFLLNLELFAFSATFYRVGTNGLNM